MPTTSTRCSYRRAAERRAWPSFAADPWCNLQVSEQQLHGSSATAGAASADQQAQQAASLQKAAVVPPPAVLPPTKPLVRACSLHYCQHCFRVSTAALLRWMAAGEAS